MAIKFESPEHESLRAAARCLSLHRGADGVQLLGNALRTFNADEIGELSPWGANYVRKLIERSLPLRGDYA